MELGDLAWDYTDAYCNSTSDDAYFELDKKIVIILWYPSRPEPGRTARVLTMMGHVKKVPIEFLSPLW